METRNVVTVWLFLGRVVCSHLGVLCEIPYRVQTNRTGGLLHGYPNSESTGRMVRSIPTRYTI